MTVTDELNRRRGKSWAFNMQRELADARAVSVKTAIRYGLLEETYTMPDGKRLMFVSKVKK